MTVFMLCYIIFITVVVFGSFFWIMHAGYMLGKNKDKKKV